MREILFRARRIDNGKWVEGAPYQEYVEFWQEWEWFIQTKHPLTNVPYLHLEIDRKTICEFTGLTDKNGKKIFEGDVVKFTDSPFGYSYTGAVCFNEGSFCIKYEYWKKEKFHRIGQTDKWQDMGASGVVTYQYEILGNIHDNPELLENP